MLRRLFGKRDPLSNPDPGQRRAAVLALSEAEAAQRASWLQEKLTSDPDSGVRRACIEKVSQAAVLERLLDDPDLGEAAVKRLLNLFPDGRPDEPTRVKEARMLALPAADAIRWLGSIEDVTQLITLALRARDPVRAAVLDHPRLNCAAGLAALEKASRDRDKKLNRHAREQLDAIKQQRQEAEAAHARAGELARALQRSAPGGDERTEHDRRLALYQRFVEAADRYDHLRQTLMARGEDLQDSADLRARTVPVAETIDRGPPPVPDPDPTSPPIAVPAGQTDDAFDALEAPLRALDEALTDPVDFPALAARRDAVTGQWLALADSHPARPEQQARFTEVSRRFLELAGAVQRLQAIDPPEGGSYSAVNDPRRRARDLDRLIHRIDWPAWAKPVPGYSALLGAREALVAEIQEADRIAQSRLETADSQLRQLASAIENGNLSDAQKTLSDARATLHSLPSSDAAEPQRRLNRLAAQLAELKDWQTFATSPKRQALCDAVTALAEQPLEPRDQADRIKALRAEWQALGPIAHPADRRLAEIFNQQAAQAFEPCRAYFADQAVQRQRNLEERARICNQLEDYLQETDWQQADIKAAEQILRAARQEWQRFHPVDRTPGAKLTTRFEDLQTQLHGHIRTAWDRNLAAKEAIVAEAETLVGAEGPQQDAVGAVKTLQRRWQAVGPTPRKPDQVLWQRFRAACDAVFAALDAGRKARQQETDAQRAHCEQLLNAFAAELDAATAETADRAALRRFTALQEALSQLPQAIRGPLQRRHEDLCRGYRALLTAQASASLARELTNLRLADEAAETVAGSTPEELAELRTLTVQAELAAGMPSAAEDDDLRLRLQVERLNAGFGGAAGPADPLTLARTWCELGAKPPEAASFRSRFFDALLKGWG